MEKSKKKISIAIVIAIIAAILIPSIVGIAYYVDSTKPIVAIADDGKQLNDDKVYDMPKNLTFTGDSTDANTVTLNVVIKPVLVANYTIEPSINWVDNSIGDNIAQYLTVTSSGKTITLTMIQRFSHAVELKAKVVNSELEAVCTVNCYKQMISYESKLTFERTNFKEVKTGLDIKNDTPISNLHSLPFGFNDCTLTMSAKPTYGPGSIPKYTNPRMSLNYAHGLTQFGNANIPGSKEIIEATVLEDGTYTASVTFNEAKMFEIVNRINQSILDTEKSMNDTRDSIVVHTDINSSAYLDDLTYLFYENSGGFMSIMLTVDVIGEVNPARALCATLFNTFDKNDCYIPPYNLSIDDSIIVG